MNRLTDQAHELCRRVIASGEVAIDATAGNGHDTLFLARQVGPEGAVFAFDRQATAIHKTETRLKQADLTNAVVMHVDHAKMAESIPREHHGRIAAVMFNLGYLPGGDKTLITQPSSTIPAIEQSLELQRPGGILTVLCYTGHAGGDEETAAVRSLLNALPTESYQVDEYPGAEKRHAPVLFATSKC